MSAYPLIVHTSQTELTRQPDDYGKTTSRKKNNSQGQTLTPFYLLRLQTVQRLQEETQYLLRHYKETWIYCEQAY